MALPISIAVEKRTEDVPRWMPAATSLGSVVLAFVVSGVVLWLIGISPLRVYGFFVSATFGSWAAFSDTMVKATPLILVGLACTVAFKMKLWNIGAEGQFYMGAFFASLVVLVPLLPTNSPPAVLIPAVASMGMVGGGGRPQTSASAATRASGASVSRRSTGEVCGLSKSSRRRIRHSSPP